MKTKFLLLMISFLGIVTGVQAGVTIDPANFPDSKFRAYISSNIDSNKNGFLSDTEIADVKRIDVSYKGISDLKGVEFFTALIELYCWGNQLITLDVSKNTTLTYLGCGNNKLTTLDISKNTALEVLDCYDNQLTALDVSTNTALEHIDCWGNQLTALDVSKNPALESLSCGGNQLTALNVTKNTALKELFCDGNQLTILDVSKNTALQYLGCYGNQLTALDVTKNTKLVELHCSENQVTALGVSMNTTLEILDCNDNQLTTLDVSKNTTLNCLYCYGNQLTALDVSKNTALEYMECGCNQLTALDVSENTALRGLYCNENQLTVLDVSKNKKLENLDCSYNQLINLDVSNNTALNVLGCSYNQLTSLDISKNTKLSELLCYGNGIRGKAMQTLVNSLCDRSSISSGYLYVYRNEAPTGNEMTTLQVAAAKAKFWQVLMCDDDSWDWVNYPGVEPPTVTLNKTEAILQKGKTMTLKATVSGLEDQSVTWKSSNTAVATVLNTGKVKGVKTGFVTITCTLNATGESATCQVTVGYVKLDQTEAVLEKTKTMTLTPTVYPSKLTDRSVTWKSSKTSVATVSSTGEVTGVKAGTAVITCTSNATGLSTTCKVTVGYVKLDQTEATLEMGETMTLTPTVYPSALDDKSVTWKSSDETIATVSSTGEVTGVKAGTAVITCTSNATGLSTSCTVTVIGCVKLNKTMAILQKGKTMTLKATVSSEIDDKSVTWKSSDKTIATVTSAGKVKGVKAGFVTITCTLNATGESVSCTVTVGYVKLDKTEAILQKGKTITLTPTVYPSKLTDRSVTWKSSDETIATVTSAGKVKGVKSGTATITCTSNATGLSTTCTVTVGTVILNISGIILNKGNTMTLKAAVYPETLEDKSVTWESSDKTIATVTSSGKVKGIAAGTATITCTSVATGLSTTCKVTVTDFTPARTMLGDDADVMGIETLEEAPAVEEPFDVYDLRGHRVLHQVTSLDGLSAGVYIVNGKKVLKK